MEHNASLRTFIEERPHLVWYVGDVSRLSVSSVVENTLNYGTWQDVQALIALLGRDETAQVFASHQERMRSNYRPEIAHYFQLYFSHVAH